MQNNSIRILKVKKAPGEKIAIEFQRLNSNGEYDDFTMVCGEQARPEWYTNLQALAIDVVDICELPGQDLEVITVKGVTFVYDEEDGRMGAVITAQKKLLGSNSPLCLNTPFKMATPKDANQDPKSLLPAQCDLRLLAIVDETVLYVNGDRAQLKMAV